MNIIKFHIRKPWFVTAGDKFNWGSGYSTEGIGLARRKLKNHELNSIVEITDKKRNKYTAVLKDMLTFFEENPSSEMIIKKTAIVVFPRSIFKIKYAKIEGGYQEPAQSNMFSLLF